MNENNEWHWQEAGTAWKGVGIYHVTLTVPSREPILGTLEIPDNDPKQAWVKWTELGTKIRDCVEEIPYHHPEVQIIQKKIMPDHLHLILHVMRPMKKSFNMVMRGFWQGVKRCGREYMASVNPHIMRTNERQVEENGMICRTNERQGDSIFTERPFVRPMSRRGQLQTMIHYVQMNPERLATKRLMPELFRVQEKIEIAGRTYKGVGHAELLQRARYMPVHVRGVWVEDAERHGDNTRLREYMNRCVLEARKGVVMVSPFISKYEQMVMDVLLKEGLEFIYIADNGFGDYYKPQDRLFDAVARKQVLILSPWEYDAGKKRVSRAECIEMNKMAEEISGE